MKIAFVRALLLVGACLQAMVRGGTDAPPVIIGATPLPLPDNRLQAGSYLQQPLAENKDAVETDARRDAELLAAAKQASIVKLGKATYVSLCQSCHAGPQAKGDSPSNLFDDKWYHGGRPHEIEHTILNGVLDKNMPPWGPVLQSEDITAVTAYLLSQQKS